MNGERLMPMIDVYAPAGLLPTSSHRSLAEQLTTALIHAEGHEVVEPFASNTAAYVHELPADAVHTAVTDSAQVVRVEVLTPPGALTRDGQREVVSETTRIVAEIANDPTLIERTWVLLKEAAEGGWGMRGVALGHEEFAALAKAAAA
jgi:phenylpyruvate tautomerase PptA (4-oxalocrotonate tautomerase family)